MLKHKAYDTLRNAIISGQLEPEKVYTQAQITKLLDLSSASVRDALIRLGVEGWLKVLPQHGVRIMAIDLSMIRNCFQFRTIIEVGCLPNAMYDSNRPQFLALLEQTREARERIQKDADAAAFRNALAVDFEMHFAIVEASENEVMISSHKALIDRILQIRQRGQYTTGRGVVALAEHVEVIEALLDQDLERATVALQHHTRNSMMIAMGI